MAKTLFDIAVAHQSSEWQNGHLVMEVGPHIFSYAVLSDDKNLLQLRIYELEAQNNTELADELTKLINEDSLLKTETEKKTLMYNFPESHLVPEKYFNEESSKELVELLHGDLNKGVALNEKIPGTAQYNIFKVPAEVHDLLKRSFTKGRYWHYYSLWIQHGQKKSADRTNSLSVMFYPNRILVGAVKNNELNLLQSFSYEAVEDVGYYLLNICNQLQLSAAETPVILSGMIDVSSALFTEIYKYFGKVELEDYPAANMETALSEYPPHFFSPLLKLALCV